MISFVIPARDEQEYITGCIDSIRNNTYGIEHEIIVLDHCSTDNTAKIARDKGVEVIPCSHKLSIGAVRNEGLLAAKYDYLCFIDADCRLDSTFRQGIRFLQNYADEGLVVGANVQSRAHDWIATSWSRCLLPPKYARGAFMFFKRGRKSFDNVSSGEDYNLSREHGYRLAPINVIHLREPWTLKQFWQSERRRGAGSWDQTRALGAIFPVAALAKSWKSFGPMGPVRRLQNIFLCNVYFLARLTAKG